MTLRSLLFGIRRFASLRRHGERQREGERKRVFATVCVRAHAYKHVSALMLQIFNALVGLCNFCACAVLHSVSVMLGVSELAATDC